MNNNDLEGATSLLHTLDDVHPRLAVCVQLVNECEAAKRRDLTEKTMSFMNLEQRHIDSIFVMALLR